MDPQDQNPEEIQTNTNGASELLSVESAIKTRILQQENLNEQLKREREMLKDMLENDPEYGEKAKIAKDAAREKTAAKQKVLSTPAGRALNQKVKDLSLEAKDIQEGLSFYLREYQRLTGANEFEGDDGELRQIVYVAKL